MPKLWIVFLIIFWLIFTSIWWTYTYKSYILITKWELTQGEITWYRSHISDWKTMYTPEVKYKCSWVEYNWDTHISSSWKPYYIWEKNEIYCIWEKFIFKNWFDKYIWLLFLIIWLIVSFIPIMNIINNIKRKKLKEELLRNWEYINAKVSFVWYNKTIAVNKRNPMYFLCEFVDNNTNELHEFKSINFWQWNINEYVKVWDLRKVYLNWMNMKRYYVDDEDIPQAK